MSQKCQICNLDFYNFKALGCHIIKNHKIKSKDYYDLYYKKEGDGRCLYCGAETRYINLNKGYLSYCSRKCIRADENSEIRMKKMRETNLKKYGQEYPSQSSLIKNKIKETNIERYGVENVYQSDIIKDKIKETNIKRYGVKNPSQNDEVKRKKIETTLKNYGVSSPMKSEIIKERCKKTCLKKYGYPFTHQNREILEKAQKSARYVYNFQDTDLFYQGTYELDFLRIFYDKFKIENGPSIPYIFRGTPKVYHSDFFIPELNLIVEIKSTYILKRDSEIEEKKAACINLGYQYLLVLDKNYNELNKKLNI